MSADLSNHVELLKGVQFVCTAIRLIAKQHPYNLIKNKVKWMYNYGYYCKNLHKYIHIVYVCFFTVSQEQIKNLYQRFQQLSGNHEKIR